MINLKQAMPFGGCFRAIVSIVSVTTMFSCGAADESTDAAVGAEDGATLDAENRVSGATPEADRGATMGVTETQIDDQEALELRWSALVSVVGEDMAERLWLDGADPTVPVYELVLENGNMVRWTEVKTGKVAISEVGPEALSLPFDLATSGASASEAFLTIAPDLPVPEAIEQLSQRQSEMENVYRKLAAAQAQFPELVHAPGWKEDGGVSQSVEDLKTETKVEGFGQLGSALNATLCHAGTSCGSCPSGNDWAVTQMNRTSNATISRSDQETVVSLGCTQTGQITHSVRYYDWWWEGWVTWFSYDLSAGWNTGTQLLQLDGGAEDFDVEVRMRDFASGDKGSQCACGWND